LYEETERKCEGPEERESLPNRLKELSKDQVGGHREQREMI
jgi:hypothetical protein